MTAFFYTICPGQEEYERKLYLDNDDTLRYRILYPEGFSRDETYPLVLFLHGSGERGSDNEKQLTHGANLFLEESNRREFPCIVIFPQCPQEDYWASVEVNRDTMPLRLDFDYDRDITTALDMTLMLVKEMKAESFVDDNRLYIMGLSMGGMGTFEAVYREPDLFTAAVPICGGADTESYSQHPVDIPFWLFHGDSDVVVSVNESREIYKVLREKGIYVSYTEYYDVNHGSWVPALAEPNLLNWLFLKKRKDM